jgi:hypothetical protein
MSDTNLMEAPPHTGLRDAIHVAVISVTAWGSLNRGDRVKWHRKGVSVRVCHSDEDAIGIVNPFLNRAEGTVWIMLYPNTVTGMKHHWSHPDFDQIEIDLELAERTIERMAETLGMSSYDDCSARDRLIQDANEYCRHQSGVWGSDYYMADPQDWENFWKAYSVVTGNPRPTENRVPFRCAC